MSSPSADDRPVSAEQFWELCRRPDSDHRWLELVGGRVVEWPPPTKAHGRVVANAAGLLEAYARRRGRGHVLANNIGVVLGRNPDTVRCPDVALYDGPDDPAVPAGRWHTTPPVLAVEVVAPTDPFAAVMRAADDYLRAGVGVVWLADPDNRAVTVCRSGGRATTVPAAAAVADNPHLPGLCVRVADLFRRPGDPPADRPPFRVKICGVTSAADVGLAAAAGADAVGLNFYPKSPRFLAADRAAGVAAAVPPGVAAVGLFVDAPAADVRAAVGRLKLAAVQSYPQADGPASAAGLTCAHVPAFRVKGPADLGGIRRYVLAHRPAAVLVDAWVPGAVGGTGRRAPWDVLAGFDPGVPVVLAGGLTADNVADAVRAVGPAAVDVASGVEAAPGRKDPGKVRAFCQAARAALGDRRAGGL